MTMSIPNKTQAQGGFVLVTSLILLVVVTLLAVSAINSSTLQERMASNLREKSRARQAADSALRRGEQLLGNPAFDTLQAQNSTVRLSVAKNPQKPDSGTTDLDFKLWIKNDMFADGDKNNDQAAFLDPTIWSNGKALSYAIDPKIPTQYYVEDYDCIPNVLSAESRAVCNGTMFYRITARAQGQNPAAIAVTQSLYEKHY